MSGTTTSTTTAGAPAGAATRPAGVLVDHLGPNSYDGRGRREFLGYRDLGLGAATDGRYRALGMKASGRNEDTGWHYHVCDVQFVYVLRGWVQLEFEGGRVERLVAGSFASIPGGTPHNETGMSDDLEVLEICAPADMGTVPIEAPR